MRKLLDLSMATCLAACSGGLGHRSTVPTAGRIDQPPAIIALRLELENGSVEVHRGPPGSVRYEGAVRRAADSAQQLEALEQRGVGLVSDGPDAAGTWLLRGPTKPEGMLGGVLAMEVRLDVPADLALEIRVAGSGDLTVEGRAAATTLTTQRGDVRLSGCAAAARIHSGRGVLIVYDHQGDLDAETGVGDMQVFVRRPGRRLRLINGMGNVQCLIPADVGFRVDARTETGKLANGFGLPIERPSAYSASMVGQRGDGATEIVMRTGTGHLSLSHKAFD